MTHAIDKDRRMDSHKMIWHMPRVIDYFDNKKRVPPIYIDMGATKRCNANCVYCYRKFQGQTNDIIEAGALVRLFAEAKAAGILGIGLVGDGEPTMNPAIYDAMRAGHETGLEVNISTNGIKLDTDERLKTVLECCTWMRFNLSAGTREGYKTIHGVDKWETVSRNIRRIVELRNSLGIDCDIGLQVVFVPTIMCQELLEECKFAIDAGVDYVVVKQCSLPDEGQSGMVQFDMDDYDHPIVQDTLEQAEDMSTDKTKIIVKWNIIEQKGKRSYDRCLGIPFLCQISGNGEVYPCGHLFRNSKFLMGNIHDTPISEIVTSGKYWGVIRYMERSFNPHTDCKGMCRQEKVNAFLDEYVHPPRAINSI